MADPNFDLRPEKLFPMAELAGKWGVTPNTVSRRIAFLGIKPKRVGNFRFLDEQQLDLAEQLQDHILSGKPMEWFERPGQPAQSEGGQVVRQAPKVSGLVAGEQAAALVAALQQAVAPKADPMARARALAEAADNGLVLTTDEMRALGVQGIEKLDGELAYGYQFTKHLQRGRSLWTVERAIAADRANGAPVRALTGDTSRTTRPVGFAAAIEASYRVVGRQLFDINRIG